MTNGSDTAPTTGAPAEVGAQRTPKDNLVVTRHETTILGKKIAYTATAGTIVMSEEAVGRARRRASSRA